jgi:hypothetical protein
VAEERPVSRVFQLFCCVFLIFSHRVATKCVDKEIRFKTADKCITELDGKEVNPELVPANVHSKNHWKAAESAISETVAGMYVDRESLKACGVGAVLLLRF